MRRGQGDPFKPPASTVSRLDALRLDEEKRHARAESKGHQADTDEYRCDMDGKGHPESTGKRCFSMTQRKRAIRNVSKENGATVRSNASCQRHRSHATSPLRVMHQARSWTYTERVRPVNPSSIKVAINSNVGGEGSTVSTERPCLSHSFWARMPATTAAVPRAYRQWPEPATVQARSCSNSMICGCSWMGNSSPEQRFARLPIPTLQGFGQGRIHNAPEESCIHLVS